MKKKARPVDQQENDVQEPRDVTGSVATQNAVLVFLRHCRHSTRLLNEWFDNSTTPFYAMFKIQKNEMNSGVTVCFSACFVHPKNFYFCTETPQAEGTATTTAATTSAI